MSLRQYFGLSSPKKRTAVDSKEKNKLYDKSKRRRTIVPGWKTEFEWLICDDSHGKIFCQPCRSAYGPLAVRKVPERFRRYAKGPFVVGCENLRHDALTTHAKSDGHSYAVEFVKNRGQPTGESVAEKTVQTLNKASFHRLEKLFRNVHAIAKKSRPISDYTWQCELDIQKGIDLGDTYRNTKSCKEFLVAISEIERGKIEEKIELAKFYTIMSDGSTDVSVIENEIVYIHFAHRGIAYCYFLGLIQCESADSKGIYAAILQALNFKNLTVNDILKRTIGFAGDGASVNTGQLNGVIAHFRENASSSVVMVQCMSHRIELAYKTAFKVAPVFTKVFSLLDDLFKFYHKSPKQTSNLTQTFTALKIKQTMPTRIGGTRWLGHVQTALNSLWKGYRAFVTHLGQVALHNTQSATQSKAKYLLKLLRSKSVIVFAHFITDVVNVLTKLSMCLQQRATCLYEVHQDLECTIANIQKLEARPGPELRKVREIISNDGKFEGELLVGNDDCEGQTVKVLKALVESLQKRFKDVTEGVKQATKIADLASWPATIDNEPEFGDEMVSNLVDHYRQLLEQTDGVDVSNIEPEWTILKNLLYKNHKVHEMNWSTINDLYQDKCANALNVIDLVLSLPAGTSECERGFSQMKIIKNQWRNKLKSTSMTLLLTIQLNSDPIAEFNPEQAIHQWNKGARRRPNFMKNKVKKTVVQQMEEIMNVIEDEIQELNSDDNLETAAACPPDKAADSDDNDSCFSDMEEYSGDEIGTGSDRSDID